MFYMIAGIFGLFTLAPKKILVNVNKKLIFCHVKGSGQQVSNGEPPHSFQAYMIIMTF